jgi:epoxyqueuosine reductase
VRGAATTWQRTSDLMFEDSLEPGLELRTVRRRDLEVIEEHRARQFRTITDEQPSLQAHERHRAISLDDIPMRNARIAVQSGGHVERENGTLRGVDCADRAGHFVTYRALQSRSQQCVNYDVAFSQKIRGERLDAAPAGVKVFVSLLCIAAQRRDWNSRERGYGKTGSLSETREHVAITAVVAAPADNDNLVCSGPARPQVAQRSLPCSLHERVSRYTKGLDRVRIESTYLSRGIQASGERHAVIILTLPGEPMRELSSDDLHVLKRELIAEARKLGFDAVGVASVELPEDEAHLTEWLTAGFHGDMEYMARHGSKRSRPHELVPGTVRVISVRMNYWPDEAEGANAVLADAGRGYVSRYALGRDYHKVMRGALARLAENLSARVGPFGYRVCVDSAPVLEKALARNAGLGWIGKHTNLLARDAGSWFFLGEILTDLPLPIDTPSTAHCGTCDACIRACPTQAIVAPYRLDARRCISYLTIEHKGAIPEPLRPALGNRIYGCDDCQLVCPWNKFSRAATHPDFKVRHRLDASRLTELFAWTASEFDERMRGSAIYRIGYERWSRNVAVALGNAPTSPEVIAALVARRHDSSSLVREHVEWALGRHNVSG